MHQRHRRLPGLLKLLIAGGLLAWLVERGVIDVKIMAISLGQPLIVVLAALLLYLAYALSAWRWKILLSTQKITHSSSELLRVVFIGQFLNNVLPVGGAGGDAYRIAYVLKNDIGHRASAVLSIIVDRVMGLYGLIVVASAMILIEWKFVLSHDLLLIMAGGVIGVLFGIPVALPIFHRMLKSPLIHSILGKLRFLPSGHEWIMLLDQALIRYRRHIGEAMLALLISISIHCITLASFLILASKGEWTLQGLSATLAWLSNLIPATPGGLGIGEAVFDQIFRWGTDGTLAGYGTFFLAHRTLLVVTTLPGVIFLLQSKQPAPDIPNVAG
jgi:uncharacterized protein (TIRG00374 family)